MAHLSGTSGPGIQTSDAYGLLGSIRGLRPSYALTGLTFSSYGVVTANHLILGDFISNVLIQWKRILARAN